jgi:uncharacterized membrane protein YphA (DoxX/SURF4 family)
MRPKWFLGLALRLVLAGIFLAAAVPKLLDPVSFLEQTANYDLFVSLSPWIAVTLPPLEALAALGLLVFPKKWRLSATLVAFVLMVVFTVAVGSAYARGLDTECGCFGKGSERIGLHKLAENLLITLGALGLLLIELRGLLASTLQRPTTSTTATNSNS